MRLFPGADRVVRHICIRCINRKNIVAMSLSTVTLSYVWLSKATNMFTNMITDKTKNIKYRTATTSVVKLVWDSSFFKSAWLNTDKTSCQDVFNKLDMTKEKCEWLLHLCLPNEILQRYIVSHINCYVYDDTTFDSCLSSRPVQTFVRHLLIPWTVDLETSVFRIRTCP